MSPDIGVANHFMKRATRIAFRIFGRSSGFGGIGWPMLPNDQLTDGGPSVTSELPGDIVRPPFGAALGSTGSLFFGSLAVNSKMLSRANQGHKAGTNMPAMSIPHTPVAITILRRVIFIADTSF